MTVSRRLNDRLTKVEKRQETFETKFDMFIKEIQDFKVEMRERDNRRAEEIRELRQRQDAQIDRIDQKLDRMDQKIDGIGKFVQNLTIAAMVGIGAAVVGIGAITVAVFLK